MFAAMLKKTQPTKPDRLKGDIPLLTLPITLLLGFIQGIAEFLPISSSGHLSLLQNFFNMEHEFGFFNVLLHLGTFVSICIVYRQDIVDMMRELFGGIKAIATRDKAPIPPARRLVMMVIVATLPLFLVLPVKDKLDALNHNTTFISCALLVTGLVLYFADKRLGNGRKTERTATVLDALLVGCAQAIATVPGLSRSGSTIAAGMLRGYRRDFAVRFSFLMSLPAVLGANLLEFKDVLDAGGIDAAYVPLYIAGFVVSAVVGYFAIGLVKKLSDEGKFGLFAYYCWAVGGLSLVASLLIK